MSNLVMNSVHFLRRIHLPRPLVIGLVVIATQVLGVGLGLAMTTPACPIIVSVVAIMLYLLVIVKAPYKGMLLWLVLYPFAETRINISLGEGIPDLSPTRFTLAFLSAMLIAQAATGQRRFPRVTKLDIWGLLFFIGISISASVSFDPIRSFQAVLDLTLVPILAYYIVKNFVTSREDLDQLFSALLVIAGYSAFFAIYEQMTGNILLYEGQGLKLTEYAEGIRILRGLWGGNAVFGSIFAMAIPVAFYRFIGSKNRLARGLYALLVGVLMVSMFLTFKRGAWISMVVSFLVMAPFFPAFRRLFFVLLLLVSVTLSLYWNRLSESDLMEQRITSRVDTLSGRTYRWQAAIDLWKQKPLVGHGFRSFDRLSRYLAVENFYLHVLVSGGLVAFIPFLMFILLTVRESVYIYIRGPSLSAVFVNRELVAVFWGMFSTYLVKAMSGAQGAAIVNILFYVIIGAMIGSQGEQLVLYDEAQQERAREAIEVAA